MNENIIGVLAEISLRSKVKDLIINVPDFPKEGIQFKDITPVLQDHETMTMLIDYYSKEFNLLKEKGKVNKIVAIESRGFIFGSLLSLNTGLPMVLARKPGKLPRETATYSYDLEYGSNSIEMHINDISSKDKVIVVDDLLATGGTISAVCKLVNQLGGDVAFIWNLIELSDLGGKNTIRKSINNSSDETFPIHSLIRL